MSTDEQPPASIWERVDRPAQAPRTTLTHRGIGAAAVGLADSGGLDAVSMRNLAGRLGVAPMALYRYVRDKEELYELMADMVYGEVLAEEPTAPGAPWREHARVGALRERALLLRHPWLVQASALALLEITPHRLALVEAALAGFDGLGLDIDSMREALRSILAYVRGATAAEIAMCRLMEDKGWQTGDDFRNAYGPQMAHLVGTGRYPVFQRYLVGGKRKDDLDWQFEFGLDCLLNGIGTRLGI